MDRPSRSCFSLGGPEAGRCFPDEQPTVGGQFFDAVRSPSRRKGKCYTMKTRFDLSAIESFSEIPACRAREVLFLLTEVDPISGKESEQYPDAYPKEYRERVEIFSRNYIWRRLTADITIEFLEAAVERMFSADEVSSVVEAAKLKELKHRIVHLFLYANSQ
jgi:hypothetical protein